MIDNKEIHRLRIFQPYAFRELMRAVEKQQRFAHYTSASTALSIIQNRAVWMRKVSCMNDYLEVTYGLECIKSGWDSDAGKKLQENLERIFPNIVKIITDLFDGWQAEIELNTYVACVSRHHKDEDKFGRLSMWRAYGGKSGVALVIKGAPFFRTESPINIFSTPVAYLTRGAFQAEFETVVENLTNSDLVLKAMTAEEVVNRVFWMLCFSALATKHPGFKEEQEWRIIHAPKIWPSEFVTKSIEVVQDQPQTIYKIPLSNDEKLGIDWMNVESILDRVIIGPTENAHAIAEAFQDTLGDIGFQNPGQMITVSDIPLR